MPQCASWTFKALQSGGVDQDTYCKLESTGSKSQPVTGNCANQPSADIITNYIRAEDVSMLGQISIALYHDQLFS